MSKSWPGGGKLQLRQTVNGGWRFIEFGKGKAHRVYVDENPKDLLVRVGENVTLLLAEKRGKLARVNYLKRSTKYAEIMGAT